jgi:Do/DeqQ family serine protease
MSAVPENPPMFLIARFTAAIAALALAGLLGGPGPASAQQRVVPTQGQLLLSYAPVVKRVAPAVVNVYAAKEVVNRNPLFDDPIFRHFFGVPGGGGGSQLQRSLGSGVIVDPSGLVVTNVHVIRGATDIKIALTDKREFAATVVLEDKRSDLAVLRIKDGSKPFPHLQFADSDALEVGDVVIALGNPFGVGQTVTHGIVSAVARTDVGSSNYQFFIQTDAAINPGNSGGALVDLNGKLVGINNMILSRSGGSQGIGFAIPANMVKVVVASAEAGSSAVRRPWLGAQLQAVTPAIADGLGLKRPAGALVADVFRGSPAARAGLKSGDLITAIDDQPVEDVKTFDYRLATKPLGGTAKLDIVRNGHATNATVALRAAPDRPRNEITVRTRSPLGGARLANLSPALADEIGLNTNETGVVIVDIEPGSLANRFNFRRGDIILSINGERIDDTRELARVADQPVYRWRMVVRRGGRDIAVEFGG